MIETKTFRGQSTVLSPSLTEMTWTFGGEGQSPLTTTLKLAPDGKIAGYSHPNEAFWRIEDHKLLLLKENGELMWRAAKVVKNQEGLLTMLLETPEDSNTHFILQQNPANNAPEPAPEQAPTVSAAPAAIPAQAQSSGIPDPEYLFPADLEVTPTKIKKVLLIGSCLTALYLEQFQKRHSDITFDYVPYNFVSVLPPAPPLLLGSMTSNTSRSPYARL